MGIHESADDQTVYSAHLFFYTFKIILSAIIISFIVTRITKQTFLPTHDRLFVQKILKTIIYILLTCIFPDILIQMNFIKFSIVPEHIPSKISLYMISFDAVYALVHFSQHKWFIWSHKEHHDTTLYPGYAFVFSPIDSLCIQLCIYSPFYFGLHFTRQTWGLTMFLIIFTGLMGHTERGWINVHRNHHRKPHEGRYSFTGIPEHVLSLLK